MRRGLPGPAPGPLVRSAAVEPGPHGVRVNAVAPGVVRTPRSAAIASAPFPSPPHGSVCHWADTHGGRRAAARFPYTGHRPSAIGGE
ncbi:SDR family oxidoreductase [Streptomyces sp. A5-4]|uniref:SDR family oxidoreductase n=1 Tax=Streptomyces sp. A5-4 TaxID=3384771 RepID=UPI003DA8F531